MSALHAEVLEAPSPSSVWAARDPREECVITDIVRYTAGGAVGVVQRFDYWNAEDGSITSHLGAGIDWDSFANCGCHDVEVYEDTPQSVLILPDVAVVLTAVYSYITEHSVAVAS